MTQTAIALAATAALTFAASTIAQDDATFAVTYDIEVKMGHQAQFEAAMKRQLEWYREHGETWEWHCWAWITGDNVGGYVWRSPRHKLAEFDARAERAGRARNHFLETAGPHVSDMRGVMTVDMTAVSNWPPDLGEVPLASIHRFEVNLGMEEQFVNAIGKIDKAMRKAGAGRHHAWISVLSGGRGSNFTFVMPHKSFEDLKPRPKPMWTVIDETLGRAEGEALRATIRECVREHRHGLASFRPDLSYRPQQNAVPR